jgi:hypothetical protein
MKLTDVLTSYTKYVIEQAKHPEVWEDNAWKSNYYFLRNRLYDALEQLDKEAEDGERR